MEIQKEINADFISLENSIKAICVQDGKEFIEEAKNIGIIGYIVKPIDEKSFIPNLEIIFNKQEEFEKLEKKYLKTSQKLEDRKKIDIAKSILMKTRNLFPTQMSLSFQPRILPSLLVQQPLMMVVLTSRRLH